QAVRVRGYLGGADDSGAGAPRQRRHIAPMIAVGVGYQHVIRVQALELDGCARVAGDERIDHQPVGVAGSLPLQTYARMTQEKQSHLTSTMPLHALPAAGPQRSWTKAK